METKIMTFLKITWLHCLISVIRNTYIDDDTLAAPASHASAHCHMQFIDTRGRGSFYRTIRTSTAIIMFFSIAIRTALNF